ncbi:nucleotide-diphospho-sugar transferase [Cokeromyces recurvatus]|uniref:nucleotide-diphospho-sugar transferase n=1 Tax=Cokeromyces recurvatus TaxID=90255 RepID=UPI00221F6289|nr:nucleotide-diphospho-sugar transferase [Cokeromyces recurvatus]KAI7897890.1 nucleotide-diphospho-sugar transferase [Cokeromyces recurvatus]
MMLTARYSRIGLLILFPFCIFLLIFYSSYNKNLNTYKYDYEIEKNSSTIHRENAAFVVLARNSDLNGIREAMQMMEDRFNHKYHYPWVFLNDQPFEEKFKEYTTGLASGKTYYGELSHDMWGYPDWIDQEKARKSREEMEAAQVIYGGVESYRHMCRFQSGFFFRHPLMEQFDYYWRVEPDVKFTCDIDYDPFKVMREKDLKYGFTISLYEYENTIPTLWKTTKQFMKEYPQHIVPTNDSESLMSWITDNGGETYNLCHFWSNFEIGSLAFLRSQAYLDYFNYLDKAGGFFYERWGDAPVHSIAVAMMLKKSDVHFFYDIGYFHNPFKNCPSEPSWLPIEKCSCDPSDSMHDNNWSCTPKFLNLVNKKVTDFVITKRY